MIISLHFDMCNIKMTLYIKIFSRATFLKSAALFFFAHKLCCETENKIQPQRWNGHRVRIFIRWHSMFRLVIVILIHFQFMFCLCVTLCVCVFFLKKFRTFTHLDTDDVWVQNTNCIYRTCERLQMLNTHTTLYALFVVSFHSITHISLKFLLLLWPSLVALERWNGCVWFFWCPNVSDKFSDFSCVRIYRRGKKQQR